MILADQIRISLKEDGSDSNLRRWGIYLAEHKVDLRGLLELLDADKYTILRFLWILGGLVEIDPGRVYPVIPYLFHKRKEITVANYERSLAKFFWLAGFPEETEAEAVDELFHWMLDAKVITTTKTYAALAIYKLSEKHESLKNELKLVIEDQLQKNGTSFEKRAGKILKEL